LEWKNLNFFVPIKAEAQVEQTSPAVSFLDDYDSKDISKLNSG